MTIRSRYNEQLAQLRADLEALGLTVVERVTEASDALARRDVKLARTVIDGDAEINQRHDDLIERIVLLIALQSPVAGDLRRLISAIDVVQEIERIGDYARSIAKTVVRHEMAPSTAPDLPLQRMANEVIAMLNSVVIAFQQEDVAVARGLEDADDRVDTYEDQVRAELLDFIRNEPESAAWAIDHMLVAHTFERIADRTTNIGEQIIYMVSGETTELNH